jgi:hypothetical protein
VKARSSAAFGEGRAGEPIVGAGNWNKRPTGSDEGIRNMKPVIMVLAAVATSSLVYVTWALTRVSAWIVFHDPVWGQMDAEGARLEHEIAETFLVVRDLHIPEMEAVIGAVFLFLLWRALPGRQRGPGQGIV